MSHKRHTRPLTKILGGAFFVFAALAAAASAQLPRPPADSRMEDMRRLQDNNHLMAEQQKDGAAMRTKEERMAVVHEAFKRLQLLHNEMMTMLSVDSKVETKKIVDIANEVKLRATELNANLALPELPKEKKKDKAAAEPQPISTATVSEHMTQICAQIREFVRNINTSPTDPKAGIQARRDLIVLIDKSDQLILSVTSPVKL